MFSTPRVRHRSTTSTAAPSASSSPASSAAPSPAGSPAVAADDVVALSHPNSGAASPADHPVSTPLNGVGTVGALFNDDGDGDHFCTASVISSPHGNLLVTAAHCIHGGRDGGYRSDLAFVPGYHDGVRPYGTWSITAAFVDPQWADSSDPDLDVGFLTVAPRQGRQIADVVGANRLLTSQGFANIVTVVGYPAEQETPIACTNHTVMHSPSQLRFDCAGYSGGTSGGPWLANYDPQTGTGDVIGVIGGYEKGGDTDDVSYTAYFDAAVQQLYAQAR
ncbi:trypsin-like serine protease [Planosporangium thailandense]|uniref:Trypsin-like serine protease n=2 Tax=Planosporangium thailandense TaxID=765197 RepID=A0ABX0XTS7_9ACTN|nr:trypsin-like serine protease [Planosporangium thailandense]NJC69396.1 trypsin-like serine protease [Planosporangium thailandense]